MCIALKTMYVWHDVALLYSFLSFERFGYILLKHHDFTVCPFSLLIEPFGASEDFATFH